MWHSQLSRHHYNNDEDLEDVDGLRQPVPYTQARRPDNVKTLKSSSTVSGKPTTKVPKMDLEYDLDRIKKSDLDYEYDPKDEYSEKK